MSTLTDKIWLIQFIQDKIKKLEKEFVTPKASNVEVDSSQYISDPNVQVALQRISQDSINNFDHVNSQFSNLRDYFEQRINDIIEEGGGGDTSNDLPFLLVVGEKEGNGRPTGWGYRVKPTEIGDGQTWQESIFGYIPIYSNNLAPYNSYPTGVLPISVYLRRPNSSNQNSSAQ